MIEHIFSFLGSFEDFLWAYFCFPMMVLLGLYLSITTKLVQIRQFPNVVRTFASFMTETKDDKRGVHPLKVFFACVGGCVGIGNLVSICIAAQIGGPGALFWIWLTAIFGMIIKYCEVYLGIRYRVPNAQGGYNGGAMYFLQKAFKNKWVPTLAAFLLCIYGVEIFQFSVVVKTLTYNWALNQYAVVFILMVLVLYAGSGGVRRVGNIATMVIPVFVVLYMGMGIWIFTHNLHLLPDLFWNVVGSAFTGHAAIGGFAGSTMLLAASQGIRQGCYTGDVGIGYASIITSETSEKRPERQASLEFMGIFLDTFLICTTSVILSLVTGLWKEPLQAELLVQTALGKYFPYMQFFMPFFLLLLGYSTINAYFCSGLKCAEYISPTKGKTVYFIYAAISFVLFSFVDSTQAQTVMMIAGGFLLILNVSGIFRLRKEISFEIVEKDKELVPAVE